MKQLFIEQLDPIKETLHLEKEGHPLEETLEEVEDHHLEEILAEEDLHMATQCKGEDNHIKEKWETYRKPSSHIHGRKRQS